MYRFISEALKISYPIGEIDSRVEYLKETLFDSFEFEGGYNESDFWFQLWALCGESVRKLYFLLSSDIVKKQYDKHQELLRFYNHLNRLIYMLMIFDYPKDSLAQEPEVIAYRTRQHKEDLLQTSKLWKELGYFPIFRYLFDTYTADIEMSRYSYMDRFDILVDIINKSEKCEVDLNHTSIGSRMYALYQFISKPYPYDIHSETLQYDVNSKERTRFSLNFILFTLCLAYQEYIYLGPITSTKGLILNKDNPPILFPFIWFDQLSIKECIEYLDNIEKNQMRKEKSISILDLIQKYKGRKYNGKYDMEIIQFLSNCIQRRYLHLSTDGESLHIHKE